MSMQINSSLKSESCLSLQLEKRFHLVRWLAPAGSARLFQIAVGGIYDAHSAQIRMYSAACGCDFRVRSAIALDCGKLAFEIILRC